MEYAEILADHKGDVRAPVHTYAEKGTYTVTQTVFNSFEGGSEDHVSKTICIMGDPVITFIDGKTTVKVTIPFIEGVPQTLPAGQIPQIDDEAFEGWYYDNKYTEEWNPTDLMDSHKTLYAKYAHSQSFVSSTYFPILILIILAVSAFTVWHFVGRRA